MTIFHHAGYVQIFDGDGAWILPCHFGDRFIEVVRADVRQTLMQPLYLGSLFGDVLSSSFSFLFIFAPFEAFVFPRKTALFAFQFLFQFLHHGGLVDVFLDQAVAADGEFFQP